MKKLRKVMTVFLSLAMIVSVLSGTGVKVQAASSNTAADNDASVTFYYDNSKTQWSEVHAYVWGGDTTTTVKGTSVGTNVYAFTVSSNYQNVLFKNTSGTSSWDKQTADAGTPQSGKIFTPSSSANRTGGTWNVYTEPTPVTYKTVSYDNSKTNWSNVYAYVWSEGDSSVTPVVLAKTSVSGNIYTFQVASTYKNILFKNTNGTTSWDQQTADTTVPSASGYTFVTDSGNNKTGGHWTGATTPVTYKMVKYDNSKTNWSNVYAYVWTEGDSSVAPVVLAKTSVSGNTYTFKVASTYNNILFKNTDGTTNWDQQTADATVPASDGYIFIPYSSANRTSGYWVEQQTNSTKRRALSIADTAAERRHRNDAISMKNVFENFTFDGETMENVVYDIDRTASEITEEIKTVFADTDEDDVSYLYMCCHGGSNGYIAIGTNSGYTGAQLRAVLDQYVKGEVVIIINCCYAGNLINKDDNSETDFADAFLEDFISDENKSGEVAADRFHVICSSNKSESSWGIESENGYTYSTITWSKGLGWLETSSTRTTLNADANGDNKVTMAELYNYSYPLILALRSDQHVVVYPENDNFVIGGRY